MAEYGLKIGNLPKITANRKIMRLLTLGETHNVSPNRQKFRFTCHHADFCVYFRPMQQGVPTASQVVHALGGGVYDAYFVGSPCRVYVYERKSGNGTGRYGLRLFNAAGGVAFDNSDEPMCPLPNMYIPPLEQWGKVLLFDAATAQHRAINMHGIRSAMAIDFFRQTYTMYRDSVLLENNQLFYVFGFGANTYAARNYNDNLVDMRDPNRFGGLSNQKPTSVGVCNIQHHQF